MNDEELAALLHSLGPRAGEVRPEAVDPVVIVRSGRRRRAGRFAAITAAVAVVAVAIAVPVTTLGSRPTPRAVVTVGVPGIPTADELTVDGMPPLACGGVAPLSVLTASGDAETANTPEAAGLRDIIAHDGTGGESPQHPGRWVLLAEHDGKAYFGQREGAVGINATVTLQDKAGVWGFYQSGGCGPVGYADGSRTEALDTYTVAGNTLTIRYVGGDPSEGDCYSGPLTMHVHEHAATVDVLAVLPTPRPLPHKTACSLVGYPKYVTVQLAAPLGSRSVRNIGYVPPWTLQSQAASQAQAAADAAAYTQARAACTAAFGTAVTQTPSTWRWCGPTSRQHARSGSRCQPARSPACATWTTLTAAPCGWSPAPECRRSSSTGTTPAPRLSRSRRPASHGSPDHEPAPTARGVHAPLHAGNASGNACRS